ncbi:hypothetical protein [Flavobacterium cellulosilyticum]|uniref:DUF4905 domain-containing protein n=1 Tax=Flavobacterium cellulosilyticum TaxID=2541731 RepID=A0A4R5CGB8_9FLAO|nr:hypothetical protein [Flavobacterium cellulosilyticum]TDD99198.1 hypothetical protein E0F76_00270 [Flavobacterium cellulosilyticum]
MKNLYLLFFIFHFSCLIAQDQKIKVTPVSTQKIDASFLVGLDGLENNYFVKNNVFYKQHKTDIWEYKNLSLGTITKIDIQNPLKIVLFYENFNTIVTLDNQLNETQKINFSENEVPILVNATGIASQNKLWIYDSLSQQIGLFDYLKNTFQTITQPIKGTLKHYESNFNSFQWIDENLNWYSCTIFGKITLLGKVPDFDQIQMISNSDLIYKKNKFIYYFTLIGNKKYLIDLDKKTFDNFYYKDQILSIFTNQEIINYKFTTP